MTHDRLSDDTQSLSDRRRDAADSEARRPAAAPTLLSPPHPENIGPYKILDVLGEGAMGIVFLAEQSAPIHRRVALKIVKLGMDCKQVLARFETEREALALMNHPNVARVLDAGSTEQGRPYFVMEHVPGISISDYCDKHRLSAEERLKLFIPVCQAVQHAHQKGIIHRDLKPSNVLVTVQDDAATPKVIDFGVAKATQQRLTERTLFTEQGQLIGTPGYMSPEQAEMTALDIDTRTDVYSLGVLLYQLLVGTLPFEAKMLFQAGYAEIQRVIREVEPPKPSTRLSNLRSVPGREATGSVDEIASKRHTTPSALEKELRGDLDWITMKAMEKDRTRRYASATELAADIARHLNHEPVVAGPPSAWYRVKKFVRRNRTTVATGALVSLALLVGAVGTTWQAVRATRERDGAVRAYETAYNAQLAEKRQRVLAEDRRMEAQAVTDFLTSALASVKPDIARGREVTVREMLDQAAAKVGSSFGAQPLVEATLRSTIGITYRELGARDAAEPHLRKALALRRQHLGDGHVRVAETLHDLGALMDDQGRYAAAEEFLQGAMAVYRKNYGESDSRVLEMRNFQAVLRWRLGDYEKAESMFREDLEAVRRARSATDPMIADTLSYLAAVLREQGEYEESGTHEQEAFEMRRNRFGPEHPHVAESLINLGVLQLYQGDYAAAESFLQDALILCRKLHGPAHPAVAMVLSNLGDTLSRNGRQAEGEQMVREAVSLQKAAAGSDHVYVGYFLSTLGAVLLSKNEPAEAEAALRESLAILGSRFPPQHWALLRAESLLGESLALSGRAGDAEALLKKSYASLRDVRGADDRQTREALARLIRFYEAAGQDDQARAYRSLLP